MDFDFGLVDSDAEDAMGPLVRGSGEPGVVCFVSHTLLVVCWDINLYFFFVATFEVDASLTPPLEALEAQQRSRTPPEGSLRAILGDVASFLRGPESHGGPSAVAGARGTVPSAKSLFGVIEGGPGLGILTPNYFALRSEVSRAFVVASSLLRSGEVERSLAQRPLEELEVRLAAVAL